MTWRIGRRGAALLIVAVIQIIIGSAIFEAPPETMQLLSLINFLPPEVWGVVWMGAGVAAIPCAFMPTGFDRYGFAVLVPAPLWWAASVVAAGMGGWPLGMLGTLRLAAFYGGYGLLVVVTSGMMGFRDSRRRGGS